MTTWGRDEIYPGWCTILRSLRPRSLHLSGRILVGTPESHRIHGAGIYANIGGILMGSMLPYIAYMDPMGNGDELSRFLGTRSTNLQQRCSAFTGTKAQWRNKHHECCQIPLHIHSCLSIYHETHNGWWLSPSWKILVNRSIPYIIMEK